MVAIKMTRNKQGSVDGHSVQHFVEGESYDVPQHLADDFVKENVAELVSEAPKEKAEKAPKNKAEKVAENK